MMKIGLPSGVSSVSFALARMVVTPMIARFGAPVVAVYGVGSRLLELGIILAVGLELGMSPLIGHALGAKNKALAWVTARKAVVMGVAVMIAYGGLMALLARPLTRMFFSDPAYADLGATFFHIMALSLPFVGAFILYEGAFTGAGNTMPTMAVGLIHAWVFQVPVIWLLSFILDLGPAGVWWGYVFSEAASSLVYSWWFARRRWVHQVV
jgi:Na+-driven multidrug efflux pump